MKSILFIIPTLSGGGAEKVLVNLVNELSYKYSITILTLFDVGINKFHLSKRIKYKYIFRYEFRGNIYLLKLFSPTMLSKLFIHGNYDYVVAFLEYAVTRIVSGYCGNAQMIAWIHSSVNSDTLKEFLSPYRSKKECIRCYNKFDKIICVSHDVLKAFKKEFPEIQTPCFVKYNVLNSKAIYRLSLEKIKENTILDKEVIKICSVGRLIPVKGYRRLLTAYKRLIDEKIALNTHFYLLGTGTEQSALEKYILDNNLTSYVTLLGYKENPYQYMCQMDLFVCSSFSEGLSTAVTEAILLGIPVLTTECSGMRELLENGDCGKIVENSELGLYNGLKEMISNKELLSHYKRKTIEHREVFNDAHVLKEIESLFVG